MASSVVSASETPAVGLKPSVQAGVASGIVGLIVFLTIHAVWILPIWFITPIALLIAGGAGALVGWAYAEIRPRLPRRPFTSLAVVGLVAVVLAPAVIVAELRDPMFELTASGEAIRVMGIGRITTLFIAELVVLSPLAGAAVGWLLVRTKRAAAAMSLAGLAFALGPGHNIPFLGGTPGTIPGALYLLAIALASAIVLVEGERLLSKRLSQ